MAKFLRFLFLFFISSPLVYADEQGFFEEVQSLEETQKIYQEIKQMNFLNEVACGTLKKEKFRNYLLQDAHFLYHRSQAYLNVLSLFRRQMSDNNLIYALNKASSSLENARSTLKKSKFFKEVDILEESFIDNVLCKTKKTDACERYVELIKEVSKKSFTFLLGALLPCSHIYQEVGERLSKISKQCGKFDTLDSDYKDWILYFSNEARRERVEKEIRMFNLLVLKLSKGEKDMLKSYIIKASRLEHDFWEECYG